MKFNDNMSIAKVLGSLPKEYEHFVASWELTMTKKVSLDTFRQRVMNAEMNLSHKKAENESEEVYKTVSKFKKKLNIAGKQRKTTKNSSKENSSSATTKGTDQTSRLSQPTLRMVLDEMKFEIETRRRVKEIMRDREVMFRAEKRQNTFVPFLEVVRPVHTGMTAKTKSDTKDWEM
jgi:hypothetical protein